MLTDIYPLLQHCSPEVAPATLQRIINEESGGNPDRIGNRLRKDGRVYALPQQPANLDQAVRWATWLYNQGYQFDAGIAQVNSQHFKEYGLTPQTVFDPCTNIRVGGRILVQFYEAAHRKYPDQQKALLAAVSAYNSGNYSTGFRNGYVYKFLHQHSVIMKGVYAYNQPPALIPLSNQSTSFFHTAVGPAQEITNPYLAESKVKGF